MVMRTTLKHGENGEVDPIKQLLFAENDARARTTQALMRRRCYDIAVFKWIVHLLGRDKSADVCDISHQEGTDTVSDLAIACVVKISWIATGATEKYVWTKLSHYLLQHVHVNDTCLLVHIIWLTNEVVTGC